MLLPKKYSPLLFLFVLCYLPIRGMAQPHLQEQLNNDSLQNDSLNFRSHFNLSLPINPETLKAQVDAFNQRMQKSNVEAEVTEIDDAICIEFYTKSSAGHRAKIHVTRMGKGNRDSIPEQICRAQLKRRFESQLEDHIEKLSKTTHREAKKKFKNSWKTFFYFKVTPRIAINVSEAIGEDLAQDIIQNLPFSFSGTDYSEQIQYLRALKKESLKAEQKFKETKELSDALQVLNKIIENVSPEQKEKAEDLKKRFKKEFCNAFEQLITNRE